MRLDPNYVVKLSGAIGSTALQEQNLTNELSSGLRVSSLSSDPVAASANVGLSASLARIDSFVQSASGVQGRLQVTDSTLGEVVTQVTSAISLAISAGNGTLSPANLQAVGKQLASLRDSLVSLANTSYAGTYVFGGSKGDTQPFKLDSTTSPATATYSGDELTQKIATPDGQQVQVNVTGSSVFTAPGADLLGTLNKLVADIGAGTTSNVAADTAALTAGLGAVSAQRSTIGTSLGRITVSSSYSQTQATLLSARQSDLLSANTTTVASQLKTVEVQHQALLGVESALSQVNLFSYLK